MFSKEETIAAVQRQAEIFYRSAVSCRDQGNYSLAVIFQRHAQYEYKYARMLMGI